MSLMKIKILNTGNNVLVSVDGKQAYTTSNTAYVEEANIKKLVELLGIEVETEVRSIYGVKNG